jgi:hypothetical protein
VSVKLELEGSRKRVSELDSRLSENKEKTAQFEKVIQRAFTCKSAVVE